MMLFKIVPYQFAIFNTNTIDEMVLISNLMIEIKQFEEKLIIFSNKKFEKNPNNFNFNQNSFNLRNRHLDPILMC